MDHATSVAGYKAYLSTGNAAYLPQSLEKTAALAHDQTVASYKAKFLGLDKEARGGHPANIALARMVRPGIFPGLDDSSVQGTVRQWAPSGDLHSYMNRVMQDSPTAQAFRPGPHFDDLHQQKAAAGVTMSPRLTGSLPDKLKMSDRLTPTQDRIQGGGNRISSLTAPPPAMGAANAAPKTSLPETPGGTSEDGMQVTQPKNTQMPTQTMAKTAMWWEHLTKTAREPSEALDYDKHPDLSAN